MSSQDEQSPDYLVLKWGTLKAWNLTSDKGRELLERYFALGSYVMEYGNRQAGPEVPHG